MTPIRAVSISAPTASARLSVGWAVAATSRSASPAVARVEGASAALARVAVQLLPPGRAFDTRPGSLLQAVCDGISREFARIHRATVDLLARLVPSSASPDWRAIFGRDPALVAAIDRPIRWADLVAALPDTWDGVPVAYAEQSRDASRASLAQAGNHLRGEKSLFTLWLVATVPTGALSQGQRSALLTDLRARAKAIVPPTVLVVVSLEES